MPSATQYRGFQRCLDAVGASSAEAFANALQHLTQAEALETLASVGAPVAPVRRDQGGAFFDDLGNRRIGLTAVYPHPVSRPDGRGQHIDIVQSSK